MQEDCTFDANFFGKNVTFVASKLSARGQFIFCLWWMCTTFSHNFKNIANSKWAKIIIVTLLHESDVMFSNYYGMIWWAKKKKITQRNFFIRNFNSKWKTIAFLPPPPLTTRWSPQGVVAGLHHAAVPHGAHLGLRAPLPAPAVAARRRGLLRPQLAARHLRARLLLRQEPKGRGPLNLPPGTDHPTNAVFFFFLPLKIWSE